MKFRFYALQLSLVCILVFIIQILFSGFTELFVLNEKAYIELWRFLTSIFLHGSMAHLLYNVFALALFGSILESLIGGRRFLLVFLITGILANIFAINFYESSLGASGAIFGVIGALIVVRPGMIVWAFGLPMPIFIAGILWTIGDIIGIFVPSNVGNIAHLAGMFLGLIFGALFRTRHIENKKNRSIKINESYMRRWEEENLR